MTVVDQEVVKNIKRLAERQSKAMKLLEVMESLEYHLVQDKKDGMWYVAGVNETGGWEFRTWWGEQEDIDAVNSFQETFPFPVWDNIAMEEYPYKDGDEKNGS